MARRIRHSSLETRTARLKLAVRRKPYSGPSLARGVALLYRRNKTNGTWVLKASDGHGKYWTKAIAEADDHDKSNGNSILNFFEAQDQAKKLARPISTPSPCPDDLYRRFGGGPVSILMPPRVKRRMTKAKTDAGIGEPHLVMGEVHALVEMTVPSDEMDDIMMTPQILNQITAIQDAACDALGLPHMPTIPPSQ